MENYYENTKVQNQQILDELITNAPALEAANVLKWYDIAKTADSNLKKILQESSKPNLEITARYLKIDSDNAKKPELAHMIIERVATLFLEPCRLCNEYYHVGLEEEPLLKCYFCGQGCHNGCYEAQHCSNGLFFICLSCESEEIKKKKLSNKKLKPIDTVDVSTQVDCDASTLPAAGPKKTMQERSYGQICDQYMKSTCAFGISGKGCQFYHPKMCRRYVKFGPHGKRGCNKGSSCHYFHPKLCNKSLKPVSQRVCTDLTCPFFHLPKTKRYVSSQEKRVMPHSHRWQASSDDNLSSTSPQPNSETVFDRSAWQKNSFSNQTDPFLGNLIRDIVKESLQMELASFQNLAPRMAQCPPQGPPFLPGVSHFSQPFSQVPLAMDPQQSQRPLTQNYSQ